MTEEIWKSCARHVAYEVSNLGRVRSLDRTVGGSHGSTRNIKGKVLSPGMAKGGHLSVVLGGQGSVHVHVLVAEAFLGPKPFPEAEVRHKNGTHVDCRDENLEWGSRGDNIRDLKAHKPRKGCLSLDDVKRIKVALAHGEKGRTLARVFGVTEASISHIKHGRHHAEVQP